jgi:putative sterol carrier protein
MADPTGQFFTGLAEQHEPLPRAVTGLVRIDLRDGDRTEHWYVQITKGDVMVSREGAEADCILAADKATFDAIVSGQMNAMVAVLRNLLDAQGKVILLTALQRLFPGRSDAAEQLAAGHARRQS